MGLRENLEQYLSDVDIALTFVNYSYSYGANMKANKKQCSYKSILVKGIKV